MAGDGQYSESDAKGIEINDAWTLQSFEKNSVEGNEAVWSAKQALSVS